MSRVGWYFYFSLYVFLIFGNAMSRRVQVATKESRTHYILNLQDYRIQLFLWRSITQKMVIHRRALNICISEYWSTGVLEVWLKV